MANITIHKIFKATIKILVAVVVLILLIPALLYVPAVQRWAKDIAVEKVSESTSMDIKIGGIYLKFPLGLTVDDVLVKTGNDTMLSAGNLKVDVAFLPLLKMKVEAGDIALTDAFYAMCSADSSMTLRANITRLKASGLTLLLKKNEVGIERTALSGGDVIINFNNSLAKETLDTSVAAPWRIKAENISLSNVRYRMQMLPTIDSLDARVRYAELLNGEVNTGECTVVADLLRVDGVNAIYLTPTAEYLATHPDTIPVEPTDTMSQIWTVKGKKIILTDANGLYAVRGAKPQPGLDMNYLEGGGMGFEIDNFYNRGMEVRVPIGKLYGKERSGLEISDCHGVFAMDSSGMKLENFTLSTLNSKMHTEAYIGIGAEGMTGSSALQLVADVALSKNDITLAYPSVGTYTRMLSEEPIEINTEINGTLASIDINRLNVEVPGYAFLGFGGAIYDVMEPERMSGNLRVDGNINHLNRFKPLLLDKSMQSEVNIPAMKVHGDVNFAPNQYSGDLKMLMAGGKLAMDGKVKMVKEDFNAQMVLDKFPIKSILPNMQFGDATAHLSASGHGFNPLKTGASLDVVANIDSFECNKIMFTDISLQGVVKDGNFALDLNSRNEGLDFISSIKSTIEDNRYDYDLTADLRNVDLRSLGLSDTTFALKMMLKSNGLINLSDTLYDCKATITGMDLTMGESKLSSPQIDANFYSNSDTTDFDIAERDMTVRFNSETPLVRWLEIVERTGEVVKRQITGYTIDVEDINNELSDFTFDIGMGGNNMIADYLKQDEMGFKRFDLFLFRDSTLMLNSALSELNIKDITLDTILFDSQQIGNSLAYQIHVGNVPGNLDEFSRSDLRGDFSKNALRAIFSEHNRKGVEGFNIGLGANFDSTKVRASLFPDTLMIGYKPWTVNRDNFVQYEYADKHIDANLSLSNPGGYVRLMTNHVEGSKQEDLQLQVKGVNLAEWLNLSPYSPQYGGMLEADATLMQGTSTLTGSGNFALNDLLYNKMKVGNISFNIGMDVNPTTGLNEANAQLAIDGRNVITARGVLNDTTTNSPMAIMLGVNRLPLKIANPFLPRDMASLSGYLSGEMSMTGDKAANKLNGYLQFDSANIVLPMFGSHLTFNTDSIKVSDNVVQFNRYGIQGANNNPLRINGTVDLADMANPKINLRINGQNVQIVDSKQKSNSEVFGKGFIDMFATIKGELSKLDVNANLSILPETNVTYVMQTDVNTIASQSRVNELVRFVNFNDTTVVDTIPLESAFAMNLVASLNVMQGALLNMYLSPDGKNRVQIEGSSNLLYTMNYLGDSHLTGRYDVTGGFVRYTAPVIGEKYFTFVPGSYVAFNGDMLNPVLSLSANSSQSATVLTGGANPVRVNFIITANVGQTLNNMSLSFDLQAANNSLVETELQGMSAAQRSAQAINLLLYNSYTGGNSATADVSSNGILYSMLSSQLNNLTSRFIKDVDISFGINEYNMGDGSTSGTGMNYSYQISKSLFNNRFKMTVGGNYDTGSASDASIAQNLFSNVSFDYNIKPSGNMILRIYNQLTDNNIYQSQVNETGIAFILRRRLNNLRDIFNFRNRMQYPVAPTINAGTIHPTNRENVTDHANDKVEKK